MQVKKLHKTWCSLKFHFCKLGFYEHNKGILDLIHTYVERPTKVASQGGVHYLVTFVDNFTKRVWAYVMKTKNEILEMFMKWKKIIETQTSMKMKLVRSNNGVE